MAPGRDPELDTLNEISSYVHNVSHSADATPVPRVTQEKEDQKMKIRVKGAMPVGDRRQLSKIRSEICEDLQESVFGLPSDNRDAGRVSEREHLGFVQEQRAARIHR